MSIEPNDIVQTRIEQRIRELEKALDFLEDFVMDKDSDDWALEEVKKSVANQIYQLKNRD